MQNFHFAVTQCCNIIDSAEDDEAQDTNLDGFIVDHAEDDAEGEGEGSGSGSGSGSDSEAEGEKRKHRDSDLDEDIDDDEYELLEENLGIKLQRKVIFLLLLRVKACNLTANATAVGVFFSFNSILISCQCAYTYMQLVCNLS